eukprot:3791945-Prorocentrum_lima.AAC.1
MLQPTEKTRLPERTTVAANTKHQVAGTHTYCSQLKTQGCRNAQMVQPLEKTRFQERTHVAAN